MAGKYIFDAEEEGRESAGGEPLEKALRERLRSVRNAGERRTIAGLAREIGRSVGDAELLRQIFEVATEVARRSARHSADFIAATPEVAARLSAFREREASATEDATAVGGEVEAVEVETVARGGVPRI